MPALTKEECHEQAQHSDPKSEAVQKTNGFPSLIADLPDFDHNATIQQTKPPNPTWKYGDGAPHMQTTSQHREIDPYAPNRPMVHNYRLLVSGIVPRPIGLISTMSGDSKSTNLAPMSYFQVIDHDPPIFVIGFSASRATVKDTYRNLKETGECVINTVSEDMLNAISAASTNAPYGVSEWDIAGFTKVESSTVKPARVKESVFSIEAKVVDSKEFVNHQREGRSVASMVLVEATRFWVREDAVNEEGSHIDLEKLRPLAQLGGMAYGRITQVFDMPRARWEDEKEKPENGLLRSLERE